MAQFSRHPVEYFSGDGHARAIAALNDYKANTGFSFDSLAADTHPNEIEAQDIVAVSMLSVNIPARASIWILTEGKDRLHDLLSQIPDDVPIWDDDVNIAKGSPAWDLWNAVDDLPGMGPTKTSKLLAAKRPHLLPVLDEVVREALFAPGRPDQVERKYWNLWRQELRGQAGTDLRSAVEAARDEAGYNQRVSVLRVIDIVVWSLNQSR